MKRREFITFVGRAAATWPLAAHAQQPARRAKIGVLLSANPEPFWTLFREGIHGLGYIETRTVQFEIRRAEGNLALLPGLAKELVRLKVDVIICYQTPSVAAAQQVTRDIPIVMAGAGDPIGQGFIASLARPGGNITGMSGTTAELGPKTLELVREIIPSVRRVAVLANANDPFTKSFLEQLRPAGEALHLQIRVITVQRVEELDAAFSAMTRDAAQAVIVQPSLPRKRAADLALQHRILAVSPTSLFAAEGGLAAYAASPKEVFQKAAVYVDKILKGSKPADLPVEQPTIFVLSINLKTAKTLGLDVPATLLARADEVIE
jgi:putative ABC transport system substrate-binding protein